MNAEEPVVASLERLAQTDDDIAGEAYARFTARHPESAGLMSHMDDYMLGRMMQDVLVLLMTPPAEIDRHYLSFEVGSHRAYGVTAAMFRPLLEAVRDTVRDRLASHWTEQVDTAWARRIDALCLEIETAGTA